MFGIWTLLPPGCHGKHATEGLMKIRDLNRDEFVALARRWSNQCRR
jgi:hypothetical protein